MGQPEHDRQLRWRSRRGMLELELALAPFVEARLADLAPSLKRRYAELLEHDDWDIYEWIQGRAEPARGLVDIVEEIRSAAARP